MRYICRWTTISHIKLKMLEIPRLLCGILGSGTSSWTWPHLSCWVERTTKVLTYVSCSIVQKTPHSLLLLWPWISLGVGFHTVRLYDCSQRTSPASGAVIRDVQSGSQHSHYQISLQPIPCLPGRHVEWISLCTAEASITVIPLQSAGTLRGRWKEQRREWPIHRVCHCRGHKEGSQRNQWPEPTTPQPSPSQKRTKD